MFTGLVLVEGDEPLAGLEPAVVLKIITDPADFAANGVTLIADLYPGALFTPELVDLNNDGRLDLVDFSILAFYWTG